MKFSIAAVSVLTSQALSILGSDDHDVLASSPTNTLRSIQQQDSTNDAHSRAQQKKQNLAKMHADSQNLLLSGSSMSEGLVLKNATRKVPCDPALTNADVGLLSCDDGSHCKASEGSTMGGFCQKDHHHGLLGDGAVFRRAARSHHMMRFHNVDETNEEKVENDLRGSRRLQTTVTPEQARDFCNTRTDCDCSGLNLNTGTGTFSCADPSVCYGGDYVLCEDFCFVYSSQVTMQNFQYTSISSTYEVSSPIRATVSSSSSDFSTCTATLNGQNCPCAGYFDAINCGNVGGGSGTVAYELLPPPTCNADCTLFCGDGYSYAPNKDKVVAVPGFGSTTCYELYYGYDGVRPAGECIALEKTVNDQCCSRSVVLPVPPVPVTAPTQAPVNRPPPAPVTAPTRPPINRPVLAPTRAPINPAPATAPTRAPATCRAIHARCNANAQCCSGKCAETMLAGGLQVCRPVPKEDKAKLGTKGRGGAANGNRRLRTLARGDNDTATPNRVLQENPEPSVSE